MNYGYNENCKGWREERKQELANALQARLNLDLNWIPGGIDPYIEIDGLYSGVRIRKITHLSDTERKELVKQADEIYDEIMGKP